MIRNPVPWPGGAKVACAITFDMDADSLVHIEHPKDSITRVSTISMLRYGPLIGVPRILDAYRRYGLRQTFFVPAWCIERYPEAVEGMVKDGHEVGFHGYIHEAPNSLTRAQEHYWMAGFDRSHRAPHRQAAARQPFAALQLLQPHCRPAGRGGLPLRLIADGRRRALRAQDGKRPAGRAASQLGD